MKSFLYHFKKLNPKIRCIVFSLLTIFFGYLSIDISIAISEKGYIHIPFLLASIIAMICWLLKSIYELTEIRKLI